MSGEFVDTNILVYAHDKTAGEKRKIASDLLLRLFDDEVGLMSVQVLMEFFITVTRKIEKPLSVSKAVDIVWDMTTWNCFSPSPVDVIEAIRILGKYRINFWDAMIVRAAASQNASVLWTEDLNEGQKYEGVIVRNPFK